MRVAKKMYMAGLLRIEIGGVPKHMSKDGEGAIAFKALYPLNQL
jgi:hypothetical protein